MRRPVPNACPDPQQARHKCDQARQEPRPPLALPQNRPLRRGLVFALLARRIRSHSTIRQTSQQQHHCPKVLLPISPYALLVFLLGQHHPRNARRQIMPDKRPRRLDHAPAGAASSDPCRWLTADRGQLKMNRMSFRGHRGLSDDLREARVGMHSHPDLLRRTLDELGEDAFGD